MFADRARNISNKKFLHIYGYDANGPCYWFEGQRYSLGSSNDTINDIIVKGSNMHMFGTNSDYYQRATYWINGASNVVGTYETNSMAHSGYVHNNNIYMFGYERFGDLLWRSCYWLNGAITWLGTTTRESDANGGYIYDNQLLVYGWDYYDNSTNQKTACYWLNGVNYRLSTTKSEIYDSFCIGSEIYFIGYDSYQYDTYSYRSRSCYWLKDGTRHWIGTTSGGLAYGGFYDEIYNTIYFYGRDNGNHTGDSMGFYTTNGTLSWVSDTLVPDEYTTAYSAFKHGSKLYILGNERDGPVTQACYWLDGTRYWLGSAITGRAQGAYLKKK